MIQLHEIKIKELTKKNLIVKIGEVLRKYKEFNMSKYFKTKLQIIPSNFALDSIQSRDF